MDGCYLRYKTKCSVNAVCSEKSPDGPECVCKDGFHGDGFNCLERNAPTGSFHYDFLCSHCIKTLINFKIHFKILLKFIQIYLNPIWFVNNPITKKKNAHENFFLPQKIIEYYLALSL